MPSALITGITGQDGSYLAELVHQGEAAEDSPVTNLDMTGQGAIIDQHRIIADHTIVTDMNIGHQQIVITDGGLGPVLDRTPVDGDIFANSIVIADDEASGLITIFQIWRRLADTGELVDVVARANDRGPPNDHVRFDFTAWADLHTGANNRPWPHRYIIGDFRGGIDNGLAVNHRLSVGAENCGRGTHVAVNLSAHIKFPYAST